MNLALQAIIMAGGEGIRLRPLTLSTPKPLVPLLDKPVMGYAVDLLKHHGMTRIGATLWYLPRRIRDAFGRGEKYGVQMRYFEETAPLGTAGSVKLAQSQLKDTFFVLSGDGLTDCDLSGALAYHRAKGALATLVLKRVNVPLPYGVVMTDKDGRITRFIEKPTWSRVFSDLVNTGIYILEPEIFRHIPDAGMPDFGKDIFPALVAAGLPVYGYEMDGYWCDVGDMSAYLSAQQALLRGEVRLPHGEGVHDTALVDPQARIEGHCMIGQGAVVGPGTLLRDAVIGERCVIGSGAVVENACLWTGSAVQDKARVMGSVICDGAVVRQGADIGEGCALGQGAVAGPYCLLRPGVRIWPHAKAAPGAVVSAGIVSGSGGNAQWTARGADCDTPENACALCAAYVQQTKARQVLTAGSGGQALLSLASGALAAAGCRVLTAGEMTAPMLSALVRALKMDGGVFAEGQSLRFMDRTGAFLSASQITAMDAAMLRKDGPPAFAHAGAVVRLTGADEMYLANILPTGSSRPLWSPVAVFCDGTYLLRLAERALTRMHVRSARFDSLANTELQGDETGFVLSETGDSIAIFVKDRALPAEQKTMLLLYLCAQKTGKLFDLPGVPRLAGQLAPLQTPDDSEACLIQRTLLSDGLAALLSVCDALRQGPLHTWLEKLPETHILTMDVACRTQEKGRILHTLCDRTTLPHTLGEGMSVQHDQGYATIVPDGFRNVVRVTGEAANAEFARELCDFYTDQIKKITQEQKDRTTLP